MTGQSYAVNCSGLRATVKQLDKGLQVRVTSDSPCKGVGGSPGCIYGCEGLAAVTFESGSRFSILRSFANNRHCASVEEIGRYSFDECQNLSSGTFESGSRLSILGECASYGCSSPRSICIPLYSVERIGWLCVMTCENLSSGKRDSEWDIVRGQKPDQESSLPGNPYGSTSLVGSLSLA
jgi:hypothetical protein